MNRMNGTRVLRLILLGSVLLGRTFATRSLAQGQGLPPPPADAATWLRQVQIQQALLDQGNGDLLLVGNRCNGGGRGGNPGGYRGNYGGYSGYGYGGYRGYSGYNAYRLPSTYQSFYFGTPGAFPYTSSFYGSFPGFGGGSTYYYNSYRPYYPVYRPNPGFPQGGHGHGHGHCR